MPIPKGVKTSYIVTNIKKRVDDYNEKNFNYLKSYKKYNLIRNKYLNKYQRISQMIHDEDYMKELRKILIDYGMNARNSQLVSKEKFHDTIKKSHDIIDEIEDGSYSIDEFKYDDELVKNIKLLYKQFSSVEALTYSGGFVITSKTMHFLIPDLFTMIDGAHIGVSLYNVADYLPHSSDGKSWKYVFPDYSRKTPNPSPRGAGRWNWDSERYCIALFYYKRLFLEWVETNKSNKDGFLKLDEHSEHITRILDKALW
jgi:hypothetical protein